MIIDLSKVQYIDATVSDPDEDEDGSIVFHFDGDENATVDWKYNRHFYELEIDELFEEFVAARRNRNA
jgi:predicted dithiol-disulfide oxidoreductase (DUF899 family)